MNDQNPDSNDNDFNPDDVEWLHTCENCGEVEPKYDEFQADWFGDYYCPDCYPTHAVTDEIVNFSVKRWKDVLDGPLIDLADATNLAIDRIDRQKNAIRQKFDTISQKIRNFIGRQYVSKLDLWMFIHGIEDAIGGIKYNHLGAITYCEYIHEQLDEIIKHLNEMSKGGTDPDEKPNETDL